MTDELADIDYRGSALLILKSIPITDSFAMTHGTISASFKLIVLNSILYNNGYYLSKEELLLPVVVSTSAEPVIISSNDIGATFGPVLRLASNGTIGTCE
jgi:hypothetical protein